MVLPTSATRIVLKDVRIDVPLIQFKLGRRNEEKVLVRTPKDEDEYSRFKDNYNNLAIRS